MKPEVNCIVTVWISKHAAPQHYFCNQISGPKYLSWQDGGCNSAERARIYIYIYISVLLRYCRKRFCWPVNKTDVFAKPMLPNFESRYMSHPHFMGSSTKSS